MVGSILELREAMECYVSFPDDGIFGGVALPEESLTTQSEETAPKSAQPVSTNSPIEEAAMKVAKREAAPAVRPAEGSSTFQTPTRREQCPNQFPGWRMAQCQRADEELKVQSTKSEPTSPMKVLEIAW